MLQKWGVVYSSEQCTGEFTSLALIEPSPARQAAENRALETTLQKYNLG